MSRPRDSVFTGGSDTYRADNRVVCSQELLDGVRTLEDICVETYDSQQLLRNGTFDLPRMSHILNNQRIFLFVKESTVRKYKSELAEEIEPQVLELLERARKGVKALERRRHALQSKLDQIPTLQAAKIISASGKLEENHHHSLEKQRQLLQDELKVLQADVNNLTSST